MWGTPTSLRGTDRLGRPHLAAAITPDASAMDRTGSTICRPNLAWERCPRASPAATISRSAARKPARRASTRVFRPIWSARSPSSRFRIPRRRRDALYTLDIGANDIGNAIAAYAQNSSFDLSSFLTQAVGNTVGAIDALYGDGARDLLYYEVPDLSIVPAFEAAGPLGGELAMAFNQGVLAGIKPARIGRS